MNRRKFLLLAGGGVVLAAGGPLGMVAARKPTKALEPWSQAGSLYQEPRKKALSYAILAPNPHNRQPWLVNLSEPDRIILTVDTDRMLPHTDPFSRQITIGLGCFLEVLAMAAAEDGYRADITLFPEGSAVEALDERPVAIIVFEQDASIKPDPLFAHVLSRRSLKEPFDLDRPVPDADLGRIAAAARGGAQVGTDNTEKRVAELRRLTHEAMEVEIDTPRTYKESVDLFRIGKTEIEANPDGIDFSGPFFETLHFVGAMSREATLDPSSTAFAEGKKAIFAQTDTAMAYVWLVTAGNHRKDQINAGRNWVRLNLGATSEGVGIHPLSQALQEYPEMTSHYAEVHKMLAPKGGTVQMLGRLGYAAPVAPSPRWPLAQKIIAA
ncbi:MAG: twin-arginine translocation pathway signal protein [Stappiaceae bacterium]